ncbi:MAG TPA: peptidoglycan-binding protein, partial [Kiloniellales bacterium]|nr:peptidoglycan-binding protein [Kiloniellales bacterium]
MKAPGFAAASALRAALLTIATIALASFEARAQSAAERIAALLEGSGVVLAEAPHLPRESLRRLYEARGGAPLWVEGNMPSPTGWAMASLIFRAGEQGLNPEKYYASQIQARALTRTERSAAELDLLLSAGLLGYAADLGSGRLEPKKTDPELFAYPDPPDPVATLLATLESGDPAGALAALAPPHEGYRRLRGLLARYRTIADAGGWPQVADGAKLERGDQGPRVETLRRRLAATGDLDSKSASGALFDETLEQAVERIQARLGLEVDGIVGKNTLAALNTSVEQRIRQIQVNMERWRWLPRDLGKRHIFINAADFRLALVEAGSPVLEMRVVVGRPYRRTPQFSENMNHIIVNPDWTVPPKLARQDILPKVRENPSYLAEHNFTVFSGWSAEARR